MISRETQDEETTKKKHRDHEKPVGGGLKT